MKTAPMNGFRWTCSSGTMDCPKLFACASKHKLFWQVGREERRRKHEPEINRERDRWVRSRAISGDRKSTRLNSSHTVTSYAAKCSRKNFKLRSRVHRRPRTLQSNTQSTYGHR